MRRPTSRWTPWIASIAGAVLGLVCEGIEKGLEKAHASLQTVVLFHGLSRTVFPARVVGMIAESPKTIGFGGVLAAVANGVFYLALVLVLRSARSVWSRAVVGGVLLLHLALAFRPWAALVYRRLAGG